MLEALFIGIFFFSAFVSFFAKRFAPGLFFPLLCFIPYDIFAALQQTGWKLDGMSVQLIVIGFVLFGIPLALVSSLGAGLGAFLGNKMKDETKEESHE